jgi:hypothetical protein
MKAIINVNGDCIAIVYSTAGYDLADCTVIDPVPTPEHDFVWDKATQTFVPRPLTDSESTRLTLNGDPRWQALKNATPAQIDTWLANNVTNLAEARQVLGLILRAIRVLAADGRLT